MAYQLGDLITTVQQRVRDTNYSTSEITQYLNDTQNDVFNEYTLPFMETTQTYTVTVNVSDITNGTGLPTNYSQAIDLTYTSSDGERVIPYINVTEIDELYADPDDTTEHRANTPIYWYYYAQTIRVFPAPSSAYTLLLRYYKKPTLLASNSDVPSIPSEFQELLVTGAAYRVMQVKDNYDQAGVLQNKYDEILQKLVVKSSVPQSGTPIVMRSNRYQVGKINF